MVVEVGGKHHIVIPKLLLHLQAHFDSTGAATIVRYNI